MMSHRLARRVVQHHFPIGTATVVVGHVLYATRPFADMLTRLSLPLPSTLGDLDFYLVAEATHYGLYQKLGAHPAVMENIQGIVFAVWAPNARRVSVVGPFNDWDGRRHMMRCHYPVGDSRACCCVWKSLETRWAAHPKRGKYATARADVAECKKRSDAAPRLHGI